MKPVNFDYARPGDVGVALKLIADDGLTVKIMAGSQSLGPMLNMRLVQPTCWWTSPVSKSFAALISDPTRLCLVRASPTRTSKIGACRT